MGFLNELRQRRRVAKWRKLRVQLHMLNARIDELETEMLDADRGEQEELILHLSFYRRSRNNILRRLNQLEVKEQADVQA